MEAQTVKDDLEDVLISHLGPFTIPLTNSFPAEGRDQTRCGISCKARPVFPTEGAKESIYSPSSQLQ